MPVGQSLDYFTKMWKTLWAMKWYLSIMLVTTVHKVAWTIDFVDSICVQYHSNKTEMKSPFKISQSFNLLSLILLILGLIKELEVVRLWVKTRTDKIANTILRRINLWNYSDNNLYQFYESHELQRLNKPKHKGKRKLNFYWILLNK